MSLNIKENVSTTLVQKTVIIKQDVQPRTLVVGVPGLPGKGVPAGGTTGQVLKKYSNAPFDTYWADESGGGAVSSVFGRTGAVTAQNGDYNTSQVTESGNLYFTAGRAITALTGQNISIFANDAGYITSSALAPYATITALNSGLATKQNVITTGSTAQYFRGDLSLATFPTNVSFFTNDAGYIENITGLITAGANITITGSGTSGSPYSIASSGGGGGSPGGGQGAIQFNDSGVFAGDESNLFWDVNQKFFGVQQATPLAPLHVAGAIGQLVMPPATLTATLVLDTAINSPASASATLIGSPPEASAPSINFTYIDNVFDGGSFTQNENPGTGSGWVCNGQTISGTIYAYQGTSDGTGIIVLNPNGLAFSVTDSVNDGTTLFQVDLANWATSFGNAAGFFLIYSDPSTGQQYNQNIGNVSSIILDGTAFADPSVFSAYPSTGASWNGYTLGYNVINGSQYSSDPQNGNNTDANNASNYLIINATFTPASGFSADGLYYQDNGGGYHNMGNSGGAFDDYGQGGGGAPASFSSIAFPYFNTSLADGSFAASSQNDGSGNFTANGNFYNYAVYEYRFYPGSSLKYFTGGYTFQVFDNGDGQPFSWGIDVNPGDGDGRIWVNTDYGGGGDMGGGTHFDDDGAQGAAPAASPNIGSFSGVTRNWSAYGEVTTPGVKYSSTSNNYSGSDSNPTGGYIYRHDLATFGNATDLKILEASNYRATGYFYNAAIANTIYEFNSGLGDATVTPANTGYQANGSNLNATFAAFATKTINSIAVWSASSPTAATIDPNNGLFYNINIVIGNVSGATYKLKRIIGASTVYQTTGSTSFQDNTTVAWAGNSTLTPTSAPTTAAIFERNVSSDTDLPIMTLRSSNGGSMANTGIQFEYAGGTKCGGVIINGSGNMRFTAISGGYQFYNASNALYAQFLPSQFLLNAAQTSYEIIWYKNSSAPILYVSASTPFFGVNHNGTTPDSNVVFSVKDGNANGYTMMNLLGSNSYGGNYITASGKVSGKNFNVDANAQVVIGFNGTNTGAQLTVYGQSTTVAGLLLANGTLKTSPLANAIENDGSNLWFTNSSGSRSKNTIYAASSSGTQNVLQKPDATGRLIDSVLTENGSLFIVNIQTEFKQSFTLDSGRYAGLGQTTSPGSGGQLWYNGTQVAIFGAVGGTALALALQGLMFSQTATGTVANTAAETSLDSTGNGTKTIPANILSAGKTIRVKGRGFFSAVSAPTLRIKIKLGANIVLDTTAVTSLNATNSAFEFEGDICCRTTGTSGTVFSQGKFEEIGSTLGAFPMTNTGTVTIATNASQVVGATAQWGTGSASNTISLTNFTIEVLN